MAVNQRRVLLQHPHYAHEISGVVTFVNNLKGFLEQLGCEVRVLPSKTSSFREVATLIRWCDVVHLSSGDLTAFLLATVYRKPILQHYHFPFWGTWKNEGDRHRGFFGCAWKSVTVVWGHGQGWRRTSKFWAYFLTSAARVALRVLCAGLANQRIAVSRFIREDAKLPMRMWTMANPLDFSRFAHLSGQPFPAVPLFVFVGRVTPEKGPQLLIEAARRLTEAGCAVRIEVVGSGDYLDELKNLTRAAGLAEIVVFHGRRTSDDTLGIMSKATAVVVPSLWDDPAPYTSTETFAVRRALVTSRRGGLPEYVGPGLLFESGEVSELVTRLMQLADNPALAARIGTEGYEFARRRCGVPESVRPLLELYNSLYGGSKVV